MLNGGFERDAEWRIRVPRTSSHSGTKHYPLVTPGVVEPNNWPKKGAHGRDFVLRQLVFQRSMFRFHVNLPVCKSYSNP